MIDKANSIFFDKELFQEDRKKINPEDEKIPLNFTWIQLRWPIGKRLHYGIQLDFNKNNEINELKYEVDITRLSNSDDGNIVFEVNRTTDVYINETIPDLLFDKLAHRAGSIFYPLVIHMDENGEIESIANHEEILRRWVTAKTTIYEDYEGELVDDYISKMEELIQSDNQILLALRKNDWFLNIFFKPIYKDYSEEMIEESKHWRYPILDSFQQCIAVEQRLDSYYNHFGAIEIIHEGSFQSDDEYEAELLHGAYKGRYVLHPRLRHIIAALGEWSISDGEDHTSVEAKIFCLPAAGKDIDYDFIEDYVDNSSFVTSEGEKVSNKKTSFWDKLFS